MTCSLITQSCARFEHVFFKIYIKSGNITEKKNKTLQDFLYFLTSKCQQNWMKLNSMRSLWLCGEKNRPFWMLCPLHIETKMKVLKECRISSVSNVKSFFSSQWRLAYRFQLTVVYMMSCCQVDVLWHCNDVVCSLCSRYFLKKVVPCFEKRSLR